MILKALIPTLLFLFFLFRQKRIYVEFFRKKILAYFKKIYYIRKARKRKKVKFMGTREELIAFLEENDKHSYFYYMRRGNGALEEKKDSILDMLFHWLLQAYIVLYLPNPSGNSIFIKMEEILNKDINFVEKMTILKNELFMKDMNTYSEAIGILKSYLTKEEVSVFLEENDKHSYFYYMRRGNGALEKQKDFILDMLFQWLLQAYMAFHVPKVFDNKVFTKMEEILNKDINFVEKMTILKNELFMEDINTYMEAIELISSYINYLERGIENLTTVSLERIRAVS